MNSKIIALNILCFLSPQMLLPMARQATRMVPVNSQDWSQLTNSQLEALVEQKKQLLIFEQTNQRQQQAELLHAQQANIELRKRAIQTVRDTAITVAWAAVPSKIQAGIQVVQLHAAAEQEGGLFKYSKNHWREMAIFLQYAFTKEQLHRALINCYRHFMPRPEQPTYPRMILDAAAMASLGFIAVRSAQSITHASSGLTSSGIDILLDPLKKWNKCHSCFICNSPWHHSFDHSPDKPQKNPTNALTITTSVVKRLLGIHETITSWIPPVLYKYI